MSRFSKIFSLFLFCMLILSCKDAQSNDLAFNSNEWKKANFRLRGRMYGNLFEQRLLVGKTRREVMEILGNPDEEDKDFVKYAVDLGTIFERWLNRNFIVITFDEQTQIVKEYLIADS